MKKLLSLCLVTAIATFGAANLPAAEKAPPGEKGEKKVQSLPFHGKVDSVNQASKTIKVGELTFQVVSATKFVKSGKPATMDDVKVGEEVGGSYHKVDGGKLELGSMRIGPKAEKTPKKEKQ